VKDMSPIKSVVVVVEVAGLGVLLSVLSMLSASAAAPTESGRGVGVEVGVRHWANWGETAKDLYDSGKSSLVSRLTYHDLSGQAREIFGRFTGRGYFVSGFIGVGSLGSGRLRDEDFPPAISTYSSTDSGQHSGSIGYATVDLGHDLRQWSHGRVGIFFGYNYFREHLNAFGCAQRAANPDVCSAPIAASTAVISQRNHWRSLRIGMNGRVQRGRWRLSGDVAAMPYVSLRGTDSHWLRICGHDGCFTGPVPEDGRGWGYQLEAMLSYRISRNTRLGLGGRYWHMQTKGFTHFEGHVATGDASPQPVDWRTDVFGLTAEFSARF